MLARSMREARRFCTCVEQARASIRSLNRCEATRYATRVGLICLGRRLVGARGPAAHGPDGMRPSATDRGSGCCDR